MVYIVPSLALVLAHTAFGDMLPRTRYTKNGGMRFFRLGRVQVSWCVCRRSLGDVL